MSDAVTIMDMPAPITDIERFDRYVDTTEDCWKWKGSLTAAGYGLFTSNYQNQYAHRWAYELFVGPVPDGLDIDHECHNRAFNLGLCSGGSKCPHRACCNPAHLAPATRKKNLNHGVDK